jgi:anti-anti-sigma factor
MHNSLIQVRSNNGLATVDLRGELDRSKRDRLRAALEMARRLASHTVVIDTTRLDFIDLTAYRLVTASDPREDVATVLVKGRAVGKLEAVLNDHPSVHDHAA